MEIELDLGGIGFRSDRHVQYAIVVILVTLTLVGLGYLGIPATPYTDAGEPQLMSWSDWQFFQAERAYQHELVVLRAFAEQLVSAVNDRPDPVAIRILADRIEDQVNAGGEPALESARLALYQASQDIQDWSTGVLDRESALASLPVAVELLK